MGSGVNFDFIKEVQIKTGGFEAQYGSALGGVINIVTQSGGNKIHGAAYVYSGPGWAEGGYNDPNVLAGRVSAPVTVLAGRHSTDFGVNVGGPLIKRSSLLVRRHQPQLQLPQPPRADRFRSPSVRSAGMGDKELQLGRQAEFQDQRQSLRSKPHRSAIRRAIRAVFTVAPRNWSPSPRRPRQLVVSNLRHAQLGSEI